MHRKERKWKPNNPKPMGFSKSSAKGKVHSNTSLPQETREKSNSLTLHLKQLEKEEMNHHSISRRKEIIKNSVQFSRSVMSNSLQPHELQHTRPPCTSPTPRVYSNPCPSSWSIQPSHPLLSPSPPSPNPSQHQGLFQWVNSSHEVTKVLEFQF